LICQVANPVVLKKEKYNIDISQAIMIGDRWSDMAAGGFIKSRSFFGWAIN